MAYLNKIKVEVSNRHVHLSRKDIDVLFGKGYELNVYRELSQPGQFAAKEKVRLMNGDRRFENVRVLGPCRERTQVELSRTDAIFLKVDAPLKLSGDLDDSSGVIIVGPRGRVELDRGVIISHRHLHVSEEEANELGLENGQVISLRVPGVKETIFGNVIVRVGLGHCLSFHIDFDDANACFFDGEAWAEIVDL